MLEVQDIMQKYGEEYRKKHKLMPYKLKTMSAIEKCRTAKLGAHIDVCDECGYEKSVITLVETDTVLNAKV